MWNCEFIDSEAVGVIFGAKHEDNDRYIGIRIRDPSTSYILVSVSWTESCVDGKSDCLDF